MRQWARWLSTATLTLTLIQAGSGVAAQPASAFMQKFTVKSDQLRDAGHGVPWQSSGFCRNKDIARRVEDAQVGGEDHDDHSLNPAPIERVALDDDDRPIVAGA